MVTEPKLKTFPQGYEAPRKMLRLNIRFDNSVPSREVNQERGFFGAAVEIWHQKTQQWSNLYQTGMRVLV